MEGASGGKVGISLLAFSPHTLAGAGTYTAGLTRALVSRAPGRYVVFVPPRWEALWREWLPSANNFLICGPDPDHRMLRVAFEQVRLPHLALQQGVETVFFPHLFAPRWRRPRAVVTVYDLLLLSKKTNFGWHKRVYHRWAYRKVAKSASHIVTISEFCRRDISDRLAVPVERLSVAPPGLDPEFVAGTGNSERRLSLPERYILSVAGSYPHKRFGTVLDAFSRLSGTMPDLHLVMAGTHPGERGILPALLAAAAAKGLAGRVQVVPRLERSDLPELFRRASALVSASEFEGFGIPVLEAMAIGCPVAASPAEAVVEVLGGCGWVANDFSGEALEVALRTAIPARQLAPAVLQKAMDRALSRYTWTASAAKVEAVWNRGSLHTTVPRVALQM